MPQPSEKHSLTASICNGAYKNPGQRGSQTALDHRGWSSKWPTPICDNVCVLAMWAIFKIDMNVHVFAMSLQNAADSIVVFPTSSWSKEPTNAILAEAGSVKSGHP